MRKLLFSIVLFVGSIARADINSVGFGAPAFESAAQTIEVPLHASTVNGNLVLCFAGQGDNFALSSPETGVTEQVERQVTGSGGDRAGAVYSKIASGEPASWTIDTASSLTESMRGVCVSLSGVDQVTPMDVAVAANDAPNTDTHATSAVTTVTDGAWVFSVVYGAQTTTAAGTRTAPAGYTEDIDEGAASFLLVAHKVVTTAGLETPGTWGNMGTGADSIGFTIAVRPAAGGSAPTFTSNPVLSSCSATGCTFNYTSDAASDTLYAMFTDTASAAPTCDAIEALTGSHGAANEATTGAADSITVTSTDTPVFPIYDAHFCIEDSGGLDSAVVTLSDLFIGNPTGEQFIAITSIGAGSPCVAFNTAVDPDIAISDYLLAPTTTSPGSFALTIGADCQFEYPGDESRQTAFNIDVYDTSIGNWHASDIDFVNNNSVPIAGEDFNLVFDIDVAWASIDICTSEFSDADGDTLTLSVTNGTLPTGLSLGGTGNCTLSGDPTTENEAGTAVTFSGDDGFGGTDSLIITFYPIDTVTMPICTGGTVAVCLNLLNASYPWFDNGVTLITSGVCDTTVPANDIISQTPSASVETGIFPTFNAVVSLGEVTTDCIPISTGIMNYCTAVVFNTVRIPAASCTISDR